MRAEHRERLLTFNKGERVQMHPATDRWMMGDRYGTVVTVGSKFILVRFDRSGKLHNIYPTNLLHMGE